MLKLSVLVGSLSLPDSTVCVVVASVIGSPLRTLITLRSGEHCQASYPTALTENRRQWPVS